MERVKGTQLCKVWFDPVWFTEEHRKTVFRSLVSAMSQLRALDPSDTFLGRHFERKYTETGPYTTVHAYLLGEIARQTTSAPSLDHKISLSLLRMFAGALPDTSLDGPPFVLSMPDFNYQNIFVDDNGEVTGLIDWDGIFAGPRQGDGEIPSREELQDSPSALQAFRAEYLAILSRLISPALDIRATHTGHILDKLTRYVFGKGENEKSGHTFSAWSLKEGIRVGDWVNG
ncbi:hypothetical protein B0H14DRAFT_3488137 [Mycena olivaceomarginata]|nr:hypothetical protein B0H14DRAFT_3488137 [Mycena olivaceomarginata]